MQQARPWKPKRWIAALALGLPSVSSCGASNDSTGYRDANTIVIPFPCGRSSRWTTPAGEDEGGFATCSAGYVHRPLVAHCSSALPRESTCRGRPGVCTNDSDCTDAPHGRCSVGGFGECNCVYGCTRDSDCEAGSICLCDAVAGLCVRAECTTDADCDDGHLCTLYDPSLNCGGSAFACQSADDECGSSEDCSGGTSYCNFDGAQRHCATAACNI